MEDEKLSILKQLGYVVDSVDGYKKYFEDIYGMKPFSIWNNRPANPVHYKNEDRMIKIDNGLFNIGQLQIELIEVKEGKCYQADFLKENGPGFNHLAFFTQNLEAQIKKFEEKGMKVLQTGSVMGGIRFAYLDAFSILGCAIELIELKKRKRKK
ncbi:MAG: VOC family protein [Candidatus Helarchaeota archaeon]